MLELATAPDNGFVSLKDISQKQNISVKYLEQIVMHLTKAGLVASMRGSQGGYRLTKGQSEYTTGEIIRAIEGNLAPVACLEHEPNTCARSDTCATLGFWQGLQEAMNSYLDGVTLEDLAKANGSADACLPPQ